MTFSDSDMLWFIWAVPVLFLICFWGLKKRARILSSYALPRGLSAIASDAAVSRRWIKSGVLLIVIALGVVALAGPQYGYRWREIEQKGVDLMVVMDCSKSMLATDIQPTRLDRAKREVVDLLNLLQGDRVGLVAFSGTAFLQCPLTLDYSAFHLFLSSLTPDFLPVGGTDIGLAIETALSGFNPEDASDKALILITDGENTGDDFSKTVEKAVEAKVRIFCIGVGAVDGAPIPVAEGGFAKDAAGNIVMSRLDEEGLKKISVRTGGSYVRSVSGHMDLDTIYTHHIRKEMSAATLSQQKKKILEDRYQWFLSLAVMLSAVELLIPSRRTQRAVLLALLMFGAPTARAANPADLMKSGESAYAAGEYDKALTHFIDAQLEAPDRLEIYYNMGNAHYKAGQFDAALKNYRQALSSDDPALRQKTYYNMGNTLFRLGKSDEAIESYESALKIDPNDTETKENLEFVKKAQEQQKPPSQDSDHSNQNEKEEKNPKDQKDPSEPKDDPSQKDEGKGAEPPPTSGEQNSPDQKPSKADETKEGSAPEPKESDGNDSEKKSGSGSDPVRQTPMDEQARRQADKMLNRLEDKPGKALIPDYRKHRVEKDW